MNEIFNLVRDLDPKWIQATAAVFAIPYAMYALKKNWKIARMAKSIDVAMHCAIRLDALAALRQDILTDKAQVGIEKQKTLIANYHNRYWAFVSDQFDYWIFGVLDHDTFFDLLCNLAGRIIREREFDLKLPEANTSNSSALPQSILHFDRLERSWSQDHGTSVRMRRVSNPQFEGFMGDLLVIIAKHDGVDLKKLAESILEHMKIMEKRFAGVWRKKVQSGLEFAYFHEAMLKDLKNPPFKEIGSDSYDK